MAQVRNLLARAKASGFGLAVASSNPEGFLRALFSSRVQARAEGDKSMEDLIFQRGPRPGQVLVLKKGLIGTAGSSE